MKKIVLFFMFAIAVVLEVEGQKVVDFGLTTMWYSEPKYCSSYEEALRNAPGDGWRLPTKEEWEEVLEKTEWVLLANNKCIVGNGIQDFNGNYEYHPERSEHIALYGNNFYWSSTSSSNGYWGLKTQKVFNGVGRINASAGNWMCKSSDLTTEGKYAFYVKSIRSKDDTDKKIAELRDSKKAAEKEAYRRRQKGAPKNVVDLGLPSGTMWATCNIGAYNPWEYGDYFAWGETIPEEDFKPRYDMANCDYIVWGTGDDGRTFYQYTKYCSNAKDGILGIFADHRTTLDPADDAATDNWGSDWITPSKEQWEELKNNCTWTWTKQGRISGYEVKGKNGNSIFLPAAGYRSGEDLSFSSKSSWNGMGGFYRSSMLNEDDPSATWNFVFYKENDHSRCQCETQKYSRSFGYSVRPVMTEAASKVAAKIFAEDRAKASESIENQCINYVDLGLPSGTLWAECNVGASDVFGYGEKFAWGETMPKKVYNYKSYKYSELGSVYESFFKYNDSDKKYSLDPSDDAATAYMGKDWRMPTRQEWEELYANCIIKPAVKSIRFYSKKNPNVYLSLPRDTVSKYTYYWSSQLDANERSWRTGTLRPSMHSFRFEMSFGDIGVRDGDRPDGLYVRAVLKNKAATTTISEVAQIKRNAIIAEGKTASNVFVHRKDLQMGTEELQAAARKEVVSWEKAKGAIDAQEKAAAATVNTNAKYVNLGLPSGTLWATCNVGANNPWEYGDYFAWGETEPKSTFSWANYKYANGEYNKLTKYCNQSSYGNNGFTDSRTTLENSDDVAYQKWGSDWCMPTKAQMQELEANCIWTWTTLNGWYGYNVKGPNGNSIFLPAAGQKGSDGKNPLSGVGGYYWSSSLFDVLNAHLLGFRWKSMNSSGSYNRFVGYTVRPVRNKN